MPDDVARDKPQKTSVRCKPQRCRPGQISRNRRIRKTSQAETLVAVGQATLGSNHGDDRSDIDEAKAAQQQFQAIDSLKHALLSIL